MMVTEFEKGRRRWHVSGLNDILIISDIRKTPWILKKSSMNIAMAMRAVGFVFFLLSAIFGIVSVVLSKRARATISTS